MSNDIKKELEDMIKVLEAAKSANTPALKLTDHNELFQKYLSSKAKIALARQSKHMNLRDKDNKLFKGFCLGLEVKEGNEEKAIEKIAKVLNEIADKNLIHSCLLPISSLKMVRVPFKAQTSAVYVIILVPEYKYESLVEMYKDLYIKDGENPNPMEDLSPELKDGEFLAAARFTQILGVKDPKKMEDRLKEEIDFYLSILPKGTVLVDNVRCDIVGISIDNELKFYNPLLKKVKKVSIDCVRCAEVVDDGLKQFNLFTGIRYYDEKSNELFR